MSTDQQSLPAQGSREWHQQRLGKITASRFCDVMTNGRGSSAMGKTAYSYMYDLIVERLTGRPQDRVDNRAVQWGHDNEPEARKLYSWLRNESVRQTGFLDHPTIPDVGGSPDGLVGDDGGVEIKCPMNSRIHLEYLEAGIVPTDYVWQVQGLLWLTNRSWWDFVSFDPRMPDDLQLFVVRVSPDEDMHDELEQRILRFREQMLIKLDRIKQVNHEAAN